MLKSYRLRSEAYFRLSEIFVNGRDYRVELRPYPVEKECIGHREHRGNEEQQAFSSGGVVEKLRMRVDKVAIVLTGLWSPRIPLFHEKMSGSPKPSARMKDTDLIQVPPGGSQR
jgi:hypothetical protein